MCDFGLRISECKVRNPWQILAYMSAFGWQLGINAIPRAPRFWSGGAGSADGARLVARCRSARGDDTGAQGVPGVLRVPGAGVALGGASPRCKVQGGGAQPRAGGVSAAYTRGLLSRPHALLSPGLALALRISGKYIVQGLRADTKIGAPQSGDGFGQVQQSTDPGLF